MLLKFMDLIIIENTLRVTNLLKLSLLRMKTGAIYTVMTAIIVIIRFKHVINII